MLMLNSLREWEMVVQQRPQDLLPPPPGHVACRASFQSLYREKVGPSMADLHRFGMTRVGPTVQSDTVPNVITNRGYLKFRDNILRSQGHSKMSAE